MMFCEHNSVDYIFLAGKTPLARRLDQLADAVRTERALDNKAVVRGYAETTYRAGSWDRDRRVIARIEATEQGLDSRYVVTNLDIGSAEWVYDSLYCARAGREPDQRPSLPPTAPVAARRSPTRSAWSSTPPPIGSSSPSRRHSEATTIRLRLLKIAARLIETAGRVRLAFAAACPEADLFRGITNALMLRGPDPWGMSPVTRRHPPTRCRSQIKSAAKKAEPLACARAPAQNVPGVVPENHE
jgi:hypothetical protein